MLLYYCYRTLACIPYLSHTSLESLPVGGSPIRMQRAPKVAKAGPHVAPGMDTSAGLIESPPRRRSQERNEVHCEFGITKVSGGLKHSADFASLPEVSRNVHHASSPPVVFATG